MPIHGAGERKNCVENKCDWKRSASALRAETMDTREGHRIVQLVVIEVLVGANTITIRHSMPVQTSGSDGTPDPLPGLYLALEGSSNLLCTGSCVTNAQ